MSKFVEKTTHRVNNDFYSQNCIKRNRFCYRYRVRSMKIIFYLWNPVPILIPDIVAAQLFILLLTCPQQQKSAPLFLLKTSLRPSETPLKAFKPYFAVCALLSQLKFCLRSRLLGVVFWLICAFFQLQKCTGNCKIIFF